MSGQIILLVLGAALLHASWNIIVKGGDNKLFESAMNALGGGLGALCILPFLPVPDKSAWGLLALSCCCHLTYYICIAEAYKVTDLSLGYTIMRGSAPMLTALVLCFMGVPLSLTGWGGVLLLCSGILALALEQKFSHKASLKGILYSLRTSFVIMGLHPCRRLRRARQRQRRELHLLDILPEHLSPAPLRAVPLRHGIPALPAQAGPWWASAAAWPVWAPTASPSGP